MSANLKNRPLYLLLLCCASSAFAAIGPLTIPMLKVLDAGELIYYNAHARTLLHRGSHFHVLTEEIGHLATCAIASIGSDPLCREIIIFDPKEPGLLEEKYEQLVQLLRQEKDVEEGLWLIVSFIKHEIFPSTVEKELDRFIRLWTLDSRRTHHDFTFSCRGASIPVMPLEAFVKAKMGVCRHVALVLAYFMDRLQADQRVFPLLPLGETFVLRDEIPVKNRLEYHAWNVFCSADGREVWHLDATWEIVKNLYDLPSHLSRFYSVEVIEREKERFLRPDGL